MTVTHIVTLIASLLVGGAGIVKLAEYFQTNAKAHTDVESLQRDLEELNKRMVTLEVKMQKLEQDNSSLIEQNGILIAQNEKLADQNGQLLALLGADETETETEE